MADLGTTTAPPTPSGGASTDTAGRGVTRRRTLPGGRAVVGALLITVAVIGVFAAWLTATAAPTTSYAVVATDLDPGDDVGPDDVRLVPMDLPPEQADRAFTTTDVAGAVALAPLAPGDLLLQGMVRSADDVPGTSMFSFVVPVGQAIAGDLESGDRIDILATDDGVTGFVATDVAVIASEQDGGEVVVTVALDDPRSVLAVARAADEASLHVASTNPMSPGDGLVRTDSFTTGPTGDTAGSDRPTDAPTESPSDAAVPDEAPDGASEAPPGGGS